MNKIMSTLMRLSEFDDRLRETRVEILKLGSNPNPVRVKQLEKLKSNYENAIKTLNGKLDLLGGDSLLFKVEGILNYNTPEGVTVQVFEMYLCGLDENECKMIMKAQANKNPAINFESLIFQAIPLKQILLKNTNT